MPGELILVVDDMAVNLKLTRMLLEHEGYEVRTAATAEEALDLLESIHPRLVLADIQLPGMDGLEMTRRIKADPRNAGVLVVALTAYAMKGDEDTAMAAGCDGYITKPIDTRALGAKLRDYINQGRPAATTEPAEAADPVDPLFPGPKMTELRHRFVDEGLGTVRKWTDELEGTFHPAGASSVAHQWVGAAGLLGFPRISQMAREAEHLLKERPLDSGQFRELLESLEDEFRRPTYAGDMTAHGPEPETPHLARVLIADDDPYRLALVKAILQSQSIECEAVTDGRAALDAIRRNRPDGVVLNLNMPGMGGYEVLEQLRNEGLDVKVLLLSSEERAAAMADDCLAGPFDPVELVVRLKRMLWGPQKETGDREDRPPGS